MHNHKRLSTRFLGSKALKAAAFSSLLVFSNAYATGLGKLTVLSSLGQPLRAEIELTSPNKEEINSLVPKVASIEAFRQANIEFNPALLSLRFAVEPRGKGYIIRVTSTQPMNEPWIDFLLEMNASNGKLVREYTALLDPAELSTGQSAQVVNPSTPNVVIKQVTPVASAKNQEQAVNAKEASSNASAKKNTSNVVRDSSESGAHQYKVKPGDTLMKIASSNLNGVSLDQMLVSIYRANPQAFVGDNMNRLKAGQILTIPDADTARASSTSDAHAVVQAHSADFNAYRNKLAGQVMNAPAEKASSSKQSATGTITTKVKEAPTPTNEALDKLKLSKVPAVSAKASASAKGFSEEDRIAKDKALAEANARVKELEKNVNDLNKLLAVPAKGAQSASAVASKPVEVKPEPVAKAASNAASAVASAASSHASTSAEKTAAAESASAVAVAASKASVDASQASAAAPAKPKPKRPAPPPAPVEEESSWFDMKYLIAGGLLLVIAGGIGVYSSRRKKNAHQFEDSILTGSSLKANSMFGSTGGQSVDTNNSVFNSNFAPSASQLDANEVDPVAEADVYIAYGRDTQAEEILKEALRTQPDRHAVRLKLLEIYYSRKDLRSYELFAGELYGMTHGEGEEWTQAASMGVALDPSNPLYAGASAPVESFASGSLGLPTQPLEDLEPDPILDSSLSEDMLDSISIIDTAHALSDDSGMPDLGLDAPQSTASELAADDGILDFDLDISESSGSAEPNASEDHSLDFAPTLPEIDAVSTINKIKEEEPTPVIDFGSIDFDLGGDDESKSAVAEPIAQEKVEPEHDSGASLDFSMESVSVDSVENAGDLEFELPELNNSSSTANDDADSVVLGESAEGGDVSDVSPYNAEMATKLDLAVAYQEIGDKEGARELLEEVIRGGSDDQVQKAKAMLEQLV